MATNKHNISMFHNTGKTATIVDMISVIGQNLLVVAPSNAAVANVALKLFATGRLDITELAVFGENCDPSVRFLNPLHRGREFRKIMDKLTTVSDSCREGVKNDFIRWLHMGDKDMTVADLSEMCPHIDTETPFGRKMHSAMLSNSNVVFCTLNSAGSAMLRSAISINTIIVDEAGQCPESEFYIASAFPRVKRMIIVGDHKQLPSTVIDPSCTAAGYGRSWLGRIVQLLPGHVHLLDTQYRMDPQILRFPNQNFYKSRILSGESVMGRTPLVEKPFLFLDTDRKGREEQNDMSWQNMFEVTAIKVLLVTDPDVQRCLTESSVPARVIVITPYKAQAKRLKEALDTLKRVKNLEIATVDSFQGQEGDIVIVSTVRTHRVGFVDNPQRLNVALRGWRCLFL
jgi:AAA domain